MSSISNSTTTIRTISDFDKLQNNKSVLIAGFPGPGLVGSISTSYIIDKLNMHQIACVESQYISPGVIFIDGKLRHPFRLYANEAGNVCVLVCEAPLMINGIYSVLDTVMDWAIKNTIQEVLVLDGIPVQGIPRSDRHTTILQSTEMEKNITNNNDNNNSNSKENNISISDNKGHIQSNFNNSVIEESLKKYTTFIGGIAGGLLSACLSNQIPCAAILVPSSSGIPDPEGAALLIESYNSIIKDENLKIDPTQLKEQGQILKRQLEQIIKSEQEQREQVTISGQRVMYG
ncbi:MAG: proteasome assembly chaperone family protein [Nitrosopumilus sp.]|nr:proteasome assembly chaperone family protein [Nitrosopumilus sp.]